MSAPVGRSRSRPLYAGAALVLLLLAGLLSESATARQVEASHTAPLMYLPSGKYLRIASLGFEEILADALFLWSINGGLFILNLLPTSYDVNGEFTFSATVPPGLSGLELGFRMFALPAGGKIMLSNEDIVIFK